MGGSRNAGGRLFLATGLLLAAVMPAAPAPADPVLALDPNAPGPSLPPEGRSYFDELFEAGPAAGSRAEAIYDLPFPFERLLAAVNDRIAPDEVQTALIPLGRSLQRFAADPHYFASPRIIMAVPQSGPAGTDRPYLKDRLYIGYQPASETIEVISYNESAGRFEFQKVEDYRDGARPRVEYAERSVCLTCHQGHAPIFPNALWSETNANPEIADRLAALGSRFHGAPVSQGVDGLDAFDLATNRANRFAVAQRLWRDGCGDAGDGARRCRAALLLAALQFRLAGARSHWQADAPPAVQADFHHRSTALWPDGLWTPDPDLPNRDPLTRLAKGVAPADVIEPLEPFDPSVPRAAVPLWQPALDPAGTFTAAAREVATFFSTGDIAWLDRHLAASRRTAAASVEVPCRVQAIDRKGGARELRLRCKKNRSKLAVDGYLTVRDGRIADGRIRRLRVGDRPAVHLLEIAGDSTIAGDPVKRLELVLKEGAAGLSARTIDALGLSSLTIASEPDGSARASIAVLNDMPLLADAVQRMAQGGAGSLEAGPLRRRALLADLQAALGGA